MSSRLRVATLLGCLGAALMLLGGCDGGSSGTGITTAQGNVGSAVAALRSAPRSRLARVVDLFRPGSVAHARSGVEDIHVHIENSDIDGRTDASGAFALRGDFAGPIGMIFELPDSGEAFRLVITVPRGGSLTLDNVRLDGRRHRITVDAQSVRFSGLVAGSDCPRGTVSMVSRESPADGNVYAVDLAAATVQSAAGSTLECGSLTTGSAAEVEGDVSGEGQVEASRIEVDDDRHGGGSGSSGSGGGDRSGDEGSSGGKDGSTLRDDGSGGAGGSDTQGGPGSD